jgi:hypothetical protein
VDDGSVAFIPQGVVLPNCRMYQLIKVALPELGLPDSVKIIDLEVFNVSRRDVRNPSKLREVLANNDSQVYLDDFLSELKAPGDDNTSVYLYVRPRSSKPGRIAHLSIMLWMLLN